jgi:hypothetical protein
MTVDCCCKCFGRLVFWGSDDGALRNRYVVKMLSAGAWLRRSNRARRARIVAARRWRRVRRGCRRSSRNRRQQLDASLTAAISVNRPQAEPPVMARRSSILTSSPGGSEGRCRARTREKTRPDLRRGRAGIDRVRPDRRSVRVLRIVAAKNSRKRLLAFSPAAATRMRRLRAVPPARRPPNHSPIALAGVDAPYTGSE